MLNQQKIIYTIAVAVGSAYSKLNPVFEITKFIKENHLKTSYLDHFSPDSHYKLVQTEAILKDFSEKELILFFNYILPKIDTPINSNAIGSYLDKLHSPISSESRAEIATTIPLYDFFGKKNLVQHLSRFFDLNGYDSKIYQDIDLKRMKFLERVTIVNKKYNNDDIFKYIGAYEASTFHFIRFLEAILDAENRNEEENSGLVQALNEVLKNDGYQIIPDISFKKFRTKYIVKEQKKNTSKSPQRLIFGAKGVKPNFGIIDVMDGDIALVANDGEALIYDRKIIYHLTWNELEEWWEETNIDPKTTLKKRLIDSLDSEAEIIFFKTYFALFHSSLGHNLPALIPQVYAAYDPLSAKDLPNGKTRIRQRVDFLMILPNLKRIIIEIDGKHHYSKDDGRADPHRYAEMVKVDRELRLRGYEVFRFGGAEFYNKYSSNTLEENTKILVEVFFNNLFKIYEVFN